MVLLHEEYRDGRRYQVRRAGGSLRLYTNGVLHSQFNPSRRTATSIWDLLTMAALPVDPCAFKRALVLGVGGGGVLRLLDRHLNAPAVTGIELDPVHLDLGKRYFGLDRVNFALVAADARQWLARCSDLFDLVVDDLFGDCSGIARRAFDVDSNWLATLARRVSGAGSLAINFADLPEFRRSAVDAETARGLGFAGGFTLRLDVLENVVAVLFRRPVRIEDFHDSVADAFGSRALARLTVRALPRSRGRTGVRGRGSD